MAISLVISVVLLGFSLITPVTSVEKSLSRLLRMCASETLCLKAEKIPRRRYVEGQNLVSGDIWPTSFFKGSTGNFCRVYCLGYPKINPAWWYIRPRETVSEYFIFTWCRITGDQRDRSPRVRAFHCTPVGLTFAIAPNVGNVVMLFLSVGSPFALTRIINLDNRSGRTFSSEAPYDFARL